MASTSVHDAAKLAAILNAAIEAFAEFGFRNTDVQVIADRAGVGKGTVYRYFGNKQDLFWAASLEVTDRSVRFISEAMDKVGPALEKIRAASLAYVEFFEANPECLEVYAQERAEFHASVPESHRQYYDQLIDQFADVLRRGIEDGELRPVNARETMAALAGMASGIAMHGCYRLAGKTVSELMSHAVDVYLRGLRVEPSTEVPTQQKGVEP